MDQSTSIYRLNGNFPDLVPCSVCGILLYFIHCSESKAQSNGQAENFNFIPFFFSCGVLLDFPN